MKALQLLLPVLGFHLDWNFPQSLWVHFKSCHQHKKEDAQIGNRREYLIFGERIHDRKAGRRKLDDGAQDDTGQQFTHQGRLPQADGKLAECSGYFQKYKQNIEKFHISSSYCLIE